MVQEMQKVRLEIGDREFVATGAGWPAAVGEGACRTERRRTMPVLGVQVLEFGAPCRQNWAAKLWRARWRCDYLLRAAASRAERLRMLQPLVERHCAVAWASSWPSRQDLRFLRATVWRMHCSVCKVNVPGGDAAATGRATARAVKEARVEMGWRSAELAWHDALMRDEKRQAHWMEMPVHKKKGLLRGAFGRGHERMESAARLSDHDFLTWLG